MIPFINTLVVPIEFTGVKGIKALDGDDDQNKIDINDMVMMESQKLNDEMTKVDLGKTSITVLLICLALLVIASTFIEWINKKSK